MKRSLLYFVLAVTLPILNVLATSGETVGNSQAEQTTIQYKDSQDPSSPSKVVTLPSHGVHQLEDRIGNFERFLILTFVLV